MKSANPFNLTDRSIDSMLHAYQEFGYKSLSRDDVIAALKRIKNKEDFKGDIIAMFLERDLREAGILK